MENLLAFVGYALVTYLWIDVTRKLLRRNDTSIGASVNLYEVLISINKHVVLISITVCVTVVLIPAAILILAAVIVLSLFGYVRIKRQRIIRKERRQARAIQKAVDKRDAHYQNVRVPTSYYVTDPRILD